MKRYLTAAEALEYLALPSLDALYRAIRDNRLPYGRIGRAYRFDPIRLDEWLVRHEQKPALRRVN